jgi:hypothetical protein
VESEGPAAKQPENWKNKVNPLDHMGIFARTCGFARYDY